MSKLPWEGDRVVDERAMREAITSRFPQLAGKTVSYLDEGWDSCAFLVDGKWVFRMPKQKGSEGDALVEIPLLRSLAGRLPVAIPEVAFDGGTFFGYRFLEGTGLNDREPDEAHQRALAPQFGAFFTALHRSPAPPTLPVAQRRLARMRERAMEAYSSIEGRFPEARAARPRLDEVPAEFDGEPVVVHNDFLGSHILLSGDRFTGVIDWSDARRGDPATDFAGLAYWAGEGLVRRTLEHYGRPWDGGLVARAAYTALCVGFIDLHYGVETRRDEFVKMGLSALAKNR